MGVGDSWGTKEEFLHPRDKNGRFRNSWKMAAGVIEKIVATLSAFNPKTFTSDEEAATWVKGQSRSNRFLTNRGPSIDRFLRDYTKINADVRAGKPNADAANIKKGMSPLPEDLILSRVMGPEAFGLDPANVGQIEELTGKLVKDKGFSSTNIGTPMPHQPGAITMSIVAPKGTQALLPSTTRPTREVILDTDQPLRITKVDPDGQGGFYVYAVASGHSDGEKSVEINKTVPQEGDVPGGGVPGDQGAGGGTAVPEVPGGSGQATGGVGQRNEGHVGIVGQGPGAGGTDQGTGEVVPEVPVKPEEGPDTRSTFRDAFDQADIKVPTVGQRRKQFMDAYNGVASGKKTPQEAVNDLDNAISVNKKIIESDKADGTDSGPLVEDVKRQQALSDLIKEHFNFTGRKTQKAPEEKTAVAEKTIKKAPVPEKKLGVAGGKPVKTEQIRKVTAREKKTPLSDELNGAYTRTNLAQLREIADKNGIKVPGDKKTKRDVFEHIVSELKRKESGAPEVPEVKKSAVAKKTAVKKAPTPPEKVSIRNESRGRVNKTVYDTLLERTKEPRKPYGGHKDADRRTESFKRAFQALAEGATPDDLDALAKKEMQDRSLHLQDAGMVGAGIMNIAQDLRDGKETAALTRARRLTLESGTRDQGEELLNFMDDLKKKRAARLRGVKAPAKRTGTKKAPEKKTVSATELEKLSKEMMERGKSPEKKNAPETPGDIDKMTVVQLRAEAKRQNKRIPGGVTRKADIVEFLKGTENKKQSEAIRKGASKPSSAEIKARLDKATSREDADKYLRDLNLTVAEQKQLAKDLNISVPARANKEEVHKTLVHWGAGRRIDSERISKAGETGRGFDKAAKKAAGEEVKAPEVPEASKPLWGTLKTHGFKDGDVVMYHGQDRRRGPSAKGEKVRIQFDPSGFTLRDPETGKVVHAGGFAHRAWFSRVPSEKKSVNTDKGLVHMTLAELRQKAKDENIDIPKNLRKKDDIVNHLADKLAEKDIAARKPEVKEPEVKAPEKKTGPTPAELKVQQQEKRRQEVETRRLERQKVAAEKKAATEKAAADKVAERQRIAQEKVQAREKATAERKVERERVAAEKKAAAEKAVADRKAERVQAAAEKKHQAEIARQAQKKQVAETEHEVKVRQKMEGLRGYLGATDKMSMADIRTWADRNKVKIPPELKTKEQIREHVLRAIAEKEVAHDVERARVPALLRELRKEGIPFLERYKYKSSSAIEEYAAKVRKVVADQGIDPKKFKPQGRLTQPQSLAMNGTLSEADLDKILPHNTDPNHPVRISGWRGSEGYEVQHGVAVRRNGITYILETTAEDADNPYHVAMLTEGFDRFHHEIPERSSYQHHYNWYLGTNPADEFWQRQYNNPNHVSLASAGNGRVNIWKQGKGGGVGNGLKTPFDYHETLNHEFGHNVDRGHSKSASPEWHDAGRDDWRANVSRWEKNRLVAVPLFDMHPLTPKREETRAYPNGISDYGKSSPAEDFAESLAYYFLDTRIAYNQDTGEPFFFEDLFPERVAYLDRLFPRRARERKALRAAERERLRQLRG